MTVHIRAAVIVGSSARVKCKVQSVKLFSIIVHSSCVQVAMTE